MVGKPKIRLLQQVPLTSAFLALHSSVESPMLAKTILAEATHGQGILAEVVAAEAIVAEPNPVETILAAAIADSRNPFSWHLYQHDRNIDEGVLKVTISLPFN